MQKEKKSEKCCQTHQRKTTGCKKIYSDADKRPELKKVRECVSIPFTSLAPFLEVASTIDYLDEDASDE